MQSKKTLGINTLSCNEGSMKLRPEWPWRGSEIKNFLSWRISTILKAFFLFPPPFASVLFHFSSVQCWDCTRSFRRYSFILQNSNVEERVLSCFLTLGERLANKFLAQHQSTFFPQWGKVLVDELARVSLCGFASAFGRLAQASTFVFKGKIFELHLGGFLLVVVVLLVVAQVRDQLIQAMRNSDPRVRMSLFIHSILIATPYLPCR